MVNQNQNTDTEKYLRVGENTSYAATLTASLVNDEGEEIWEGTFMYDNVDLNPKIGVGCWPSFVTSDSATCLDNCHKFYDVVTTMYATMQLQSDLLLMVNDAIANDE